MKRGLILTVMLVNKENCMTSINRISRIISMLSFVIFIVCGAAIAHAGGSSDTGNANAAYDRGVNYYNNGDYNRAITEFTAAIRINQNQSAYYTYRGLAYFRTGDYDRAIADFNQVIQWNPNNDSFYNARGLAYHYKGDYDRAIVDYEAAIRLDPNRADSMNNLALAQQRQLPSQSEQSNGQAIPTQADVGQAVPAQPQNIVTVEQGNTLAEKFDWLKVFAQSNTSYIVEVNADESINDLPLSFGGKNNITISLRGIGASRTILLLFSGGWYINVGSGITLILDNNIILRSSGNNSAQFINVSDGGLLIMNSGSTITGNTRDSAVCVSGGTFIMTGGTISGNTSNQTSVGRPAQFHDGGGGVYVRSGTFTMTGGTISSNIARESGAGVYVAGGGTFTMSGGTITRNNASYSGGGVYVAGGTFIMNGGTISDNSGGGVDVDRYGTLTMSDGAISGNSGRGVMVSGGTFNMSGGTISGNNGSGVMVWGNYIGIFNMSGGTISGNTARENGGGVCFIAGRTFTKTGGTIYGYSAGDANSNVVRNESGAVQNFRGHAVWAGSTDTLLKIREGTAGPGDNLSYDGSKTPPTASGAWDN